MTPSDPLETLLSSETKRTSAARGLGESLAAVTTAAEDYRHAWRAATAAGWAKTDLVRAGFLDPARLPRLRPAASPPPRPAPGAAPADETGRAHSREETAS